MTPMLGQELFLINVTCITAQLIAFLDTRLGVLGLNLHNSRLLIADHTPFGLLINVCVCVCKRACVCVCVCVCVLMMMMFYGQFCEHSYLNRPSDLQRQ